MRAVRAALCPLAPAMGEAEIEPVDPEFDEDGRDELVRWIAGSAGAAVDPDDEDD